MITPDGELVDVCDLGTSLESKLSKGSVVVESGHGGKVLAGNAWAVGGKDESIGVGRVSNNDGLAVTLGIVVHGLSSIDEDLTIVLEQVRALHAGSSGLGSNEEGVVNVLEGN